jgi:type II secretory pathway pseudopilin PulG
MTLIELLVAMVISIVLGLVSLSLLLFTMNRTGEVTARVNTTQRARTTMDTMTRLLRSQVCVLRGDDATMTKSRSIYSATPTSIAFFADLTDPTAAPTASTVTPTPTPTPSQWAPKLHTLAFNSTTGAITDTATLGTASGTTLTPTYKYVATPASTILLSNVAAYPATTSPVFTYYAYDTTVTPPVLSTTPMTVAGGGLTLAQLNSVAMIAIAFRANPIRSVTKRGSSVLQDRVFLRDVDPDGNTVNQQCP